MKNVYSKVVMLLLAAVLTTGGLTGCTYKYDEFNRRVMEEGETYSISYARIISVTPVTIKEQKYNSDTAATIGAIGGAAVGGVIGYNSHHHTVHHHPGPGWGPHHHHHHDTFTEGSTGGMLVGGLIGAGLGYLAGSAVEGANNVEGLRLNLVSPTGENFALDVPKTDGLAPGGYVQVNTTQSGYSQVIPITVDAYNLAMEGFSADSSKQVYSAENLSVNDE